jgi:hypothetical protein
MLREGGTSHSCPECGVESKRIVKVGSVRVTERIDNGLMAKGLDRLQNVDELIDERNANHKNRFDK